MSTWSGKTLGKVLIGDLIARGGMAEVYEGTHIALNRKVAVKIMRDHVEEDPETRARFEREARVVANLHHPNIIQIFDYDLADGRPCLIMELVSGATLGSYLKAIQKRGEKLPFPVITRLLTAIASAIDYAHAQNIVHRDIKPANILLRSNTRLIDPEQPLPEDVEPVLTDFGLVRLLDSTVHTSTGTVSGTPAYMSPEQARGDRVDRKTDLYSFGVVVYEMFAGAVPFDAESSFGVLMKHLNEPPPPITGISRDLQAVIDRALAKDPHHRYESASEFIKEFVAVYKGQSLSADTKKIRSVLSSQEKEPPQKQSPRFVLPLAITLVIAALAIVGFFIFRGSATPQPNQQVGRITYIDFNNVMDKALISVNGLPPLKKGSHYEVWYLAPGSDARQDAGSISMQEGNTGQLTFLSPESENIFSQFNQVEITLEPDNDPGQGNARQVVASSVFPPQALIPIRQLLVSSDRTPDQTAVVQGLWITTDDIDTSIYELDQAYKSGDETTFREKIEEVINQLAGDGNSDLYKDWNGDGQISDPAMGFGLLPNGKADKSQGYIPLSVDYAQRAAQAPDTTGNIKQNSADMIVCARNIEGWAHQMLDSTIQLQSMAFAPEMQPVIDEIKNLSSNMLYGVDANQDGKIEPVIGEGGADTAYGSAYFMADMLLFPGQHRIPPP